MLTKALVRAVSFSARRPLAIVAGAILLVIAALAYSATHFDMTTDTGAMISAETDWRRNDTEMTIAFPQTADAIAATSPPQAAHPLPRPAR